MNTEKVHHSVWVPVVGIVLADVLDNPIYNPSWLRINEPELWGVIQQQAEILDDLAFVDFTLEEIQALVKPILYFTALASMRYLKAMNQEKDFIRMFDDSTKRHYWLRLKPDAKIPSDATEPYFTAKELLSFIDVETSTPEALGYLFDERVAFQHALSST